MPEIQKTQLMVGPFPTNTNLRINDNESRSKLGIMTNARRQDGCASAAVTPYREKGMESFRNTRQDSLGFCSVIA